MESPFGASLKDVHSETEYRISDSLLLLGTTKCTMYKDDTVTEDSKNSEGDSYIINLLGRPIMTEEERLYRKIQRRRPKMLKLASLKGLLCE